MFRDVTMEPGKSRASEAVGLADPDHGQNAFLLGLLRHQSSVREQVQATTRGMGQTASSASSKKTKGACSITRDGTGRRYGPFAMSLREWQCFLQHNCQWADPSRSK